MAHGGEAHEAQSFLRNRTTWVVAAFVALFLVVVGIAQATRDSGDDPVALDRTAVGEASPTPENAGAAPAPTPVDSPVVTRDPQDMRGLGSPNAPVVVTVWTDFRCPFCAVFNRDTLPTLVTEYVETGKVRFEFHDVAMFGEDSMAASAAAEAAGEQGKFMEYMSAVYAAAPESGHPDMPLDKLVGFARTAGVPDIEAFKKAAVAPGSQQQTLAYGSEAQQIGVNSVPSFLTGNSYLSGAHPVSTFREYLDAALATATR